MNGFLVEYFSACSTFQLSHNPLAEDEVELGGSLPLSSQDGDKNQDVEASSK